MKEEKRREEELLNERVGGERKEKGREKKVKGKGKLDPGEKICEGNEAGDDREGKEKEKERGNEGNGEERK